MSAHIHTYKYVHTHIQNVHINTRKHAWNDGAAANVQGAIADQGLCTSLSFDLIKPHFAPPMQGLHCTNVLQHQYPCSGAAEPQYASTQESKPENDQSDCSGETKGQ